MPRFDHRWQMTYELEKPLKLPAGSKLVVTAHYDNSKAKMHNPAPAKEVYFLDMNQSWDEMFTPFIQNSIDNKVPLCAGGTGEQVFRRRPESGKRKHKGCFANRRGCRLFSNGKFRRLAASTCQSAGHVADTGQLFPGTGGGEGSTVRE